jgi:exodeoxyribonuclease V gamma subunit
VVLHIHRAERADRLVTVLGGILAQPLDDPMAAELVAVPTRGVERWVAQQLSTGLGTTTGREDGVCANVEFPFPARLVDAALAAGGSPATAAVWRPERLVWPLLEVVAVCRAEEWCASLGAALGDPSGPSDRRFGIVRHVADLFDRYGVHRPTMVRAWARGEEVDDLGQPLPADAVWQARLWSRLRHHVGVPSPAEHLRDACAVIAADPDLVDLPPRLSLFGVTRVPATHAEVLRALARGRDVHLFALHPSPVLWADVAAGARRAVPILRRDDPSAAAARHPLLASWGRDAREMQLVLTGGVDDDVDDRHHPVHLAPRTLLERIQDDVRTNVRPPGVPFDDGPVATPAGDDHRMVLDAHDRSVSVHSCHGRARQVEVLRDAVLHLLAEDPTLEPRDVIVMCPDVEVFAPLIHAAFGAAMDPADEDPATLPLGARPVDLRVRLADRSLRQTNPVLGVVSELLELAGGRLTASQVLDLAARHPVRARFGFDDDDLGRLEEWVGAAGIRWGLDADHRRPYGLGDLDANTWRSGLDRLLLGAAMTEDDLTLVGGVLPLDDVDSGDLDLAGRLAELVGRLVAVVAAFGPAQPIGAWMAAIADAAAALTATADGDEWQTGELRRLLGDVLDEATPAALRPVAAHGDAAGGDLTLPEIRALLADRLRGRPTRANFRTGHLTVCTLVPMRSVPHRVVCLLGLDDGVFPRPGAPDGDDLVQRAPCVGDRDARSEDRQLLLDALLAATDTLLVTYSGRDPRTNARLPPAVPLGELLDVVDATARDADGGSARHRITVEHPLQPFDARNFTPGASGRPGPWSFDPVNRRGADALRRPSVPVAPGLAGPLPARPPGTVEIDDLVRFVQHPVRAFLRQRLGISLTDRSDEVDDGVPIELDGLGRWGVGDRMLNARLRGVPAEVCEAAEVARGTLPPGVLGEALVTRIAPVVERLVGAATARSHTGTPRAIDISVEVGDGDTVVGTIGGLIGAVAGTVTYSNIRARQRLDAWVRLLALSAAEPDTAWSTVTIGQYAKGVGVVTLGPLPGSPGQRARTAIDHLRVLVDLYRRGMREPLPLYAETSAAWAAAVRAGRDGVAAARASWESEPGGWDREDRDAEHRWVLGGAVELAALLDAGARPDESGEGWPDTESTRIGRYAVRLWAPLLELEQIEPA